MPTQLSINLSRDRVASTTIQPTSRVEVGGLTFQRKNGISVILPNWNHGRYIRRAVEAILRQDRLPCEIIIIDDGSTDDSLAIINELAVSSSLIRVFSNSINEGLIAAQLRALAAATGQYIHLAAADDTILPGFYSLAVKMLEQYPEAGLFAGDSLLIDGVSGRLLSMRPIVMPSFKPAYLPPSRVRKALARADNWILTGASVIRADAFNACGGLDKDLGSFADGFLVRKIALTRGFCYAPQFVSNWVIFSGGASRSTALDVEKAIAMLETAQVRIAADPIFPSWYAKRFVDRWRFAVARLALEQEDIKRSTVLALGAKTQLDKAIVNLVLSLSSGLLARVLALAWLFVRLRPYRIADLATTFVCRKFFQNSYSIARTMAQPRGKPPEPMNAKTLP
jgi:glycosyltransferase involved in cell wall biosynthesis